MNGTAGTYGTRTIGVRDEYAPKFGRQALTIWSGAYCSDYDGHALELPRHDGFMLTAAGTSVRVACESPRTEDNYLRVDAALQEAFTRLAVTA